MTILLIFCVGSFVYMHIWLRYFPTVFGKWFEKELKKIEEAEKKQSGENGSIVERIDSSTK